MTMTLNPSTITPAAMLPTIWALPPCQRPVRQWAPRRLSTTTGATIVPRRSGTEKERLAALDAQQRIVTVADEKQITGGGGKSVKKVRARKAATKAKANEGIKKERIRKATNARVKKK